MKINKTSTSNLNFINIKFQFDSTKGDNEEIKAQAKKREEEREARREEREARRRSFDDESHEMGGSAPNLGLQGKDPRQLRFEEIAPLRAARSILGGSFKRRGRRNHPPNQRDIEALSRRAGVGGRLGHHRARLVPRADRGERRRQEHVRQDHRGPVPSG